MENPDWHCDKLPQSHLCVVRSIAGDLSCQVIHVIQTSCRDRIIGRHVENWEKVVGRIVRCLRGTDVINIQDGIVDSRKDSSRNSLRDGYFSDYCDVILPFAIV